MSTLAHLDDIFNDAFTRMQHRRGNCYGYLFDQCGAPMGEPVYALTKHYDEVRRAQRALRPWWRRLLP